MSNRRNLTGVGTLVAAILAATVAAASISMPLTSNDSRMPAAPQTPTTPPITGSEPLAGEHALEYLSLLAREAVAAGETATESPDNLGESHGTRHGSPSAAQRGEPVGAGGTRAAAP
jgi:hypothetical protein